MAEAVISNGAISLVQGVGEDALETAVREHARLVYRVAYSVLRNHHDAEDATQEVFVRVLRNRSKLEAVKDLKAWLARIAWRVAVDRRRKADEISLHDAEMDSAVSQLRSQLAANVLAMHFGDASWISIADRTQDFYRTILALSVGFNKHP